MIEQPAESGADSVNPTLRQLGETRQEELREGLDRLGDDGAPETRRGIEAALDALEGLLTGNLARIPPVVAAQLSTWLASSMYLGSQETREREEEARDLAAETGEFAAQPA
jgi:hypothetical protein